jgi:acyl carrier protein
MVDQLIEELKVKIVNILDLANLPSTQLDVDGPLIGGSLGLDSIDVLEMVIMLEKDYGLRIDNRELGEKVFASLATLAAYVSENSPKLRK